MSPPKKKGGGLLHDIARYSGAEFAGNLATDVGETAIGIFPGLVKFGKAAGRDVFIDPNHPGRSHVYSEFVKPTAEQYREYYGHDVLHHLYTHPLQPLLDAATVATVGAGSAAKLGLLSDARAELVTRSPRNIATGHGPVHTDISSTRPLIRGRETVANKARAARPTGTLGIGGEVKRYGKQIQAEANQSALGRLIAHEPYQKATKGLSEDEWQALHIRALDIHPDDLAELWHGRQAAASLTPKVRALVTNPSERMLRAEPEMRALSAEGADLYKGQGRLSEETAAARPDLTRRQAADVLGRPVRSVTGRPYYFPHTLEPQRSVNPLEASGGGKGVPRKLGSMKQNTGALALTGKIHLRSDVLGPEFLRRVKYVKYDEIHNALVRGAIRVTREQIDRDFGGKLPKGYEYVRAYAGQKIPATIRGEGDQSIRNLIPNAEDLHDSQLARDGFSTTDPGLAHQSGGKYYIAPTQTIKAATGEFTRSSDFTRNFVKRPLSVWRAVVLGLRVGFLTNNLVGNSIMYAAKTGGQGALRDLFMAIRESHGDDVARKALDNAATPAKVRADLYKEFFPEQVRGTFGRTQSPSTSPGHAAASKAVEIGRTVTGAIPRLTSKVAEEVPRKALIRHYIRHSPEFKAVYSSLPRQTRTFEQAARKLLQGSGGAEYQRYISKQVNQALGDYLHLSPTERNVLRNTFPFYAWYKAITTTTFHLAVDTPLRANILGQIGQIGKQWSDQALGDVPSYLRGAIPLGKGPNDTERVLSTQGLNPYATLEQLRRGSLEDFSSLGLNPFVEGSLQQIQRGKTSPWEIAGGAATELVRGLPPARVAFPKKPSRLYPNRGRRLEGLGYLGVPVKEYDRAAAASQYRLGR